MADRERDWEDLAAAWRATRLPAADVDWLRRRVAAKRRRLLGAHLLDTTWAVALISLLGWFAWRSPEPWALAWAATGAVFTLLVLAVVTWNRRDLWRPAAASVGAHLTWSLRRCRRQLRTIRLAWGVYAGAVVLVAALLGLRGRPLSALDIAFVAGYLLLFAAVQGAWSAWYRRRVRREMARLVELRDELERE